MQPPTERPFMIHQSPIKPGTFVIQATAGRARAAELTTAHGVIRTPAFVPCATHGSLRGVNLGDLSSQLILANAYHLYLRPGIETIETLGGLHRFMNWDRPIITDSGGFQAFALGRMPLRSSSRSEAGRARGTAPLVTTTSDGIRFRSHLDGSEHFFTPELVIDLQERIGVDIATCLDVCTGFPASAAVVARAVSRTNEWGRRSVERWTARDRTLLYGMIQGSIYRNLRQRAVEELATLPFSGFAIGGNMYTFGQSMAELVAEKPRMWDVVSFTTSLLPNEKPRHLLGVGEPNDLIEGVRAGVDTFDCVMATRIARHGSAWIQTSETGWRFERIDLAAARWTTDRSPLDPTCDCLACHPPKHCLSSNPTPGVGFSRGYLRHLVKVTDPLGLQLLSLHNLRQLERLMAALRQSILDGTFDETFPQPGPARSGTI